LEGSICYDSSNLKPLLLAIKLQSLQSAFVVVMGSEVEARKVAGALMDANIPRVCLLKASVDEIGSQRKLCSCITNSSLLKCLKI
jgi:hypothetical protein